MNLEEIKAAVYAGKTVHWSNTGYTVIVDNIGQWLIKYTPTGHCIGLTWADGSTVNGKEEDFFLAASIFGPRVLPLTHQLFRGATSFMVCEVTCENEDEIERLYERRSLPEPDPDTCCFTLYGYCKLDEGEEYALLDGGWEAIRNQALYLQSQGAEVRFIGRDGRIEELPNEY